MTVTALKKKYEQYKYTGKWVCTSNTKIFIEVYYERNINYKTSIRIAI